MPNYRLAPPLAGQGPLIVGDANQRGSSWVWLGNTVEAGAKRALKLDLTSEHVVAIVGKRGTGKSYSLGVLLEGLASNDEVYGFHASPRATLVLDVLDVFWSSALPLTANGSPEIIRQHQRAQHARLQIPTQLAVDTWVPAGANRPGLDLETTRVFRISPGQMTAEDWATLFEIDLVSEPRGMLLDELVRKVSSTGWSDAGGAFTPPMEQYSIPDVIDCLDRDADIDTAYADVTKRSVRQRLANQAANPMFGGEPTALNELLMPGRVAIMMLGRLPDAYKRMLTSVLIKQIVRSRRDASFAQKRLDLDTRILEDTRRELEAVRSDAIPRTWILVDEAQVLAPNDEQTLSKEVLVKYAKEGRNYGLSLAIATQQPSAVDIRLMSQVETSLIHQLGTKADIDLALRNIKSPLPTEVWVDTAETNIETLIRLLGQGHALLSCANGGPSRACVISVRPRISPHGGYEA